LSNWVEGALPNIQFSNQVFLNNLYTGFLHLSLHPGNPN